MSRLAIELYNCLDQEINEPDPVRYWGISTSRGGKKWRKEIANFSDIKSILDSSMNESTITLKCQMIIIPKHGCFMMFSCVLQVTKWAETNPRWCDTTRNVRENQINHFTGRTQQTHTLRLLVLFLSFVTFGTKVFLLLFSININLFR